MPYRRVVLVLLSGLEEISTSMTCTDRTVSGKFFASGKSIDIPQAANTLRYYAGAADKIHGEVLKMSRELQASTLREPNGVVRHIIPWNFPTSMFFGKASPALAAGCTMVIADQTPLSALYYAHLAKLVS